MTPDAPPLSVAYFSPGWPPSVVPNGIVTYLGALVRGLDRLGHRATILTRELRPGAPGAVEPPAAAVYDLEADRPRLGPARRALDAMAYRVAPGPARDAAMAAAIGRAARRAADEQGARLLEIEESFGWATRAAAVAGLPSCVRLHGPWFLNGPVVGAADDAGYRRRLRAEGRAIAAADAILSPSRDVLERTRSHYGLPLPGAGVIPYPVPIVPADRRWRPEGAEPGLVLFVGRFDRHKGGDLMIDAFARLSQTIPDARLRFVGPDRGCRTDDGRAWSLPEYVEHRLPGALASGRVEWTGPLPNTALDDHRRRASVTVVASRYETFGMVVTEAMALGCPLVAAGAGGIAELFVDGEHGLMVPPGDPDALAVAIAALLADPARAATLGAAAAAEAERRYAPEVVAARIVAFYRRMLGDSASSRGSR